MQDLMGGAQPVTSPNADQIMTRVSEGRFDENFNQIAKEIIDEALLNLDWWAAQVWWFLPNGFDPGPWRLHPSAPASLNQLNGKTPASGLAEAPTALFGSPTLVPIEHAEWLPGVELLRQIGVRQLVVLDIIAEDRPSARLVFIVPTRDSLGPDELQFLHVSALLLPKMVVRERARTELHYRSTHDPLTGLLNRRGLNQLLELTPAVKKTLRAVLFIDLNKFKEVNDLFGHATGDELLIHVASELSNQIRPTDALARIGGDEFVIVAAEVASPHAAELFAKRLWSAVAAPFTFTNGSTWNGSGSIGVALWQPGDTYAEALREADALMYRAKKAGGGIEVQSASAEDASANAEDILTFTPISDLRSGEARGCMVAIESVLSLPETQRLAAMIIEKLKSEQVQACSDIWLKLPKGFWLDSERIAGLLQTIQAQSPELTIDLVLSCASASYESRLVARELMDRFDVGLVLDAFGSGNRDLELLQLLTPVALIVDPLSMQPDELGGDDQTDFDWAVPRSVIAIANVLGVDSVAPMAATASQLKSFGNLGCDLWFGLSR